MQLHRLFLLLPWLLPLAAACPCTYKDELGEVTCHAGTQDLLPFSLPPCLSQSVRNEQVQRMILMDQNFPHLVLFSFRLFPNLHHLDLSNCGIANVEEHIFDDNPKLNSLILKRNYIGRLPALFQSSDNSLRSLYLRQNLISLVDTRNLHNLLILNLDDNSMTEDGVIKMMALLPNIYSVSLESNIISRVDKHTFEKQEKIQFISLWNNNISYIQPGSFDHLINIRTIDLKSNPLTEYTTEAWHFCHGLNKETLAVRLEDNQNVIEDLKVDAHTDSYCAISPKGKPSVSTSCSNEEGHLSCSGNIEDLACELKETEFKSVTFLFPKDESRVKVENYFEAETNSYFKEINQINGKSNMTKYLSDLKLYGTKFDLATLDDHLGLRTETVTIFADTVYMSRPLKNPIKSQISIRARVVSISEDISMKMTKQQFFQHLVTDHGQPVDNWASVLEVISGVGNVTFSVRKQGFIEVQKEHQPDLVTAAPIGCSPRNFSVQEYETEHHTPASVFFDRVQMNLLRMAVRTLASTRQNDPLAMAMADHTLLKTTNLKIVKDKKAYITARKLVQDQDKIGSNSRHVPFYAVPVIKQLAEVMYDQMTLYSKNETILMLKLDNSIGRMTDMNKNFEEARSMRELYFERELQTLKEIWNSTDTAWKWNFEARKYMEKSIQDSIQKNGIEMFQMEKNELKEMVARAKDTRDSDQAVVDKFEGEVERYSEAAQLSLDDQSTRIYETNNAGQKVKKEIKNFEQSVSEWKDKQAVKAANGFFGALVGLVTGIATENPVAIVAAGEKMQQVAEDIITLIKVLASLKEMIKAIYDTGMGSTIALGTAKDWRGALENAYDMKKMTNMFDDLKILGQTNVESVSRATDYGVDPAGLQQAMYTFSDRGSLLVKETINFSQLMMQLADLAGELKVAKLDLEIAFEQEERVKQMHEELKRNHGDYIQWMNKHRDDYQEKCAEFEAAYNTASTEAKEAFIQQIIDLFDKFKKSFEDSNRQYITMMNNLTGALYTKVASVKQHSMFQRGIIMNLYQDFCDGIFFFSFTECYNDNPAEQLVPTMSDDFATLLEKLTKIEWDSITSLASLPNLPSTFNDVSIVLMDQRLSGFDSSARMFGPVTSLRESHEAYFNLKNHADYFDYFYRVRLDSIEIHLLDAEGNIFPSPANEIIMFTVYFPLEFNDKDADGNVHSFRAMGHFCPTAYKIEGDGEITTISSCEVDQEFNGVNHKTTHDGVFRIVAKNIKQKILDQVGGIKITVGGSYATKGK